LHGKEWLKKGTTDGTEPGKKERRKMEFNKAQMTINVRKGVQEGKVTYNKR